MRMVSRRSSLVALTAGLGLLSVGGQALAQALAQGLRGGVEQAVLGQLRLQPLDTPV